MAGGFELCFSLPASPLIASFCFFPMTDKCARGERNRRHKFTSLRQIYTRGLESRGESGSVVRPAVRTQSTSQSSRQKVWQSAVMLATDNSKAFLLTCCHRAALPLPFPWAPTAPISRKSRGAFLEGCTKTGAPSKTHSACGVLGLGQGSAGPCAAFWEPPASVAGLSLRLEPCSSCTACWRWRRLHSPLTAPRPLLLPVRRLDFFKQECQNFTDIGRGLLKKCFSHCSPKTEARNKADPEALP